MYYNVLKYTEESLMAGARGVQLEWSLLLLLWLSNCEWNQLDGREAGLDLIIGDFGEM